MERAITGINVTPLVDVTLVLLVVFMVTARGVTQPAIPVKVPAMGSGAKPSFVVAIDARGAMTVDGRAIDDAALVARARGEKRAVIHASHAAAHGAVVRAMDDLRTADVTDIAFAR